MVLRTPDAQLTFANFARSIVAGAVAALKIGMEILHNEQVQIDSLLGHGGYFKTPVCGQQMMADMLRAPVSVMETAGEGGPWGMAVLAAYAVRKETGETLEDYLNEKVFKNARAATVQPCEESACALDLYTARFSATLDAQRAAEQLH